MRARRTTLVMAGLLAFVLYAGALLRPGTASAASCVTTVAGDVCIAQCIGEQQRLCGHDHTCHKDIADVIQSVAKARAGTTQCADLVAMVRQVCGCEASPSGAFLNTWGALF
jgi:hypothetical protein